MTADPVAVASRSTTAAASQRERLAGESSMWVFVLGDLVIFAAYFIIFMVARTRQPHVFLNSQQHLNQTIGVVNTLVLLASSWFVARGVVEARAGRHRRATTLTLLGGLCGVAFILLKVYEWSAEVNHGYTFTTNNFFSFYYALTGVHLLHVVLGLIILGVVVRELRNPALRRPAYVESGAIFWHMVDLLWIVMFALIYLMR